MANRASTRLQPAEGIADQGQDLGPDEVLVHVRYQSNGEVFSIDEKPERLSPGEWLKHLMETASPYYQTFAGGRGFFRIPRSNFETLIKLLSA
jgi:hypothetical protein